MSAQIGQAALEVAFALVLHAAHGGDKHGGGRRIAGLLHDNVEIFFRAQISGEAALIHDVVRKTQSYLLAKDAASAMRDVSERPGVDKRGSAVGGLREIRENRFAQ